jgi:hypothetical protein
VECPDYLSYSKDLFFVQTSDLPIVPFDCKKCFKFDLIFLDYSHFLTYRPFSIFLRLFPKFGFELLFF